MFDERQPVSPENAGAKRMNLRYAGRCRLCGANLPARTKAWYEPSTRTVRCISCQAGSEVAEPPGTVDPQPRQPAGAGTAGLSARREYERRKAGNEKRLRSKWGRLGRIAVILTGERQSTKAWEQGAIGEERLGARLDSLVSHDIAVLHDRRIPGTMANIDHMVITRTGIWVIDAKRYNGRPTLKTEGGILRPRTEKLVVGRRDRTKLVDSALRQVSLVQAAAPDVPVFGALCFVDADWPLLSGALTSRGIHILPPKRLVKVLVETGTGEVDIPTIRDLLAARFVPASPRP